MSWNQHIKNAILAAERVDYHSCEVLLRDALKEASETFSRDDSRLALSCSLLGQFYFRLRAFSKAESLLEQAWKSELKARKINEPCLLMDAFVLAEIKKSKGQTQQACQIYLDTINCLKSSIPSEPDVVRNATKILDKFLASHRAIVTKTGEIKKPSGEIAQKPATQTEAAPPPASQPVKKTEPAGGRMFIINSEYGSDDEDENEATIDEGSLDDDAITADTTPVVAEVRNALNNRAQAQAGNPAAAPAQAQTPVTHTPASGPAPAPVGHAPAPAPAGGAPNSSWGAMPPNSGHYTPAQSENPGGPPPSSQTGQQRRLPEISQFNSMIELWQKQFDTGVDLLMNADDDEAEKYVSAYLNLESAFRLTHKLFTPTELRRAKTMAALGAASARLHMYEQAEQLYATAFITASLADDANVEDRASIKLEWAAVYSEQDNHDQAEAYYEEACKILQEAGKSPDETQTKYFDKMKERRQKLEAACDHVTVAEEMEAKFDFEKAAKSYNTALSVLKQVLRPDDPLMAVALAGRARMLRLCQNEPQAIELEQRLERIEKAKSQADAKWEKLSAELPRPKLDPIAV
jgi:tetratricopeptide (TPR) repeat protein